MASDAEKGALQEEHYDEENDGDVRSDKNSSSGSDSEEDNEGEEGKRAREIEEDEAEALKRDLGEDIREGKRARRWDPSQKVEEEKG
jgi:hypothetical protein